jgi:hypothetical protein
MPRNDICFTDVRQLAWFFDPASPDRAVAAAAGGFSLAVRRRDPLAGILAGAGVEARNALERDVVAAWRDYEVDDGMQIRQRIVIATALR